VPVPVREKIEQLSLKETQTGEIQLRPSRRNQKWISAGDKQINTGPGRGRKKYAVFSKKGRVGKTGEGQPPGGVAE